MSYKDSLGLPASPSLHNVWAGYSCSASLRGLLIQTVHIMQKLHPSRHYGNSHPNSFKCLFISQPSANITSASVSTVSNDTTVSQIKYVGFLLYLKRTRNFLFLAEQHKIIFFFLFSLQWCLPLPPTIPLPGSFMANSNIRKFLNRVKGHSGGVAQLNRKEYFRLSIAL